MKSLPSSPITLIGAALTLGLSLTACSHSNDTATADAQPMLVRDHDRVSIPADSPLRKRLQVATVIDQASAQSINVPAMVEAEPSRTIQVLAPLTGRVLKVNVQVGDQVHRGQVLALLASGDMDQAYADAAKAADALRLTREALQRTQGVQRAGGAATKDLEAAQSAYNQALAENQRAQARLTSLGAGQAPGTGGTLPLVSPINGVVTSSIAAPGSNITDTTAPLMTLVDTSEVWVTAEVPESQIGLVKPGQQADINLQAYPGETLHGKVGSVDAILQADSRRSKVRILLSNPDQRLMPNMFANAVIQVPQPDQILVPQSALLMNNDSVFVFVEVAPWTFVRRAIDISYDDQANTRVQSGLKSGERVIVSGGVLLND
ncbi:efflux RND transporter periplasmic adaptor subunit [Frateuria aurantia]